MEVFEHIAKYSITFPIWSGVTFEWSPGLSKCGKRVQITLFARDTLARSMVFSLTSAPFKCDTTYAENSHLRHTVTLDMMDLIGQESAFMHTLMPEFRELKRDILTAEVARFAREFVWDTTNFAVYQACQITSITPRIPITSLTSLNMFTPITSISAFIPPTFDTYRDLSDPTRRIIWDCRPFGCSIGFRSVFVCEWVLSLDFLGFQDYDTLDDPDDPPPKFHVIGARCHDGFMIIDSSVDNVSDFPENIRNSVIGETRIHDRIQHAIGINATCVAVIIDQICAVLSADGAETMFGHITTVRGHIVRVLGSGSVTVM